MAILDTGTLNLPAHIASNMFEQVTEGSSVAVLSGQQPMKFGEHQSFTFSLGEAEFVGEGQQKASTDFESRTRTVKPYKAQITFRYNEEVKWASEDYQLSVLNDLSSQMAPKLARALDFGIFHGISPLQGTAFAGITEHLSQTTNSVTAGADKLADMDAAEALVVADGGIPNGLALDPGYAVGFRSLRDDQRRRIFPDFNMAVAPSNVDGFRASVNETVGGGAVADTGINAFAGDFSKIYWGVQKNVGLHLIEYGDPDGQGDLQRNNQIALRAEVVYGWAIFNLDSFAKIVPEDDSGNP